MYYYANPNNPRDYYYNGPKSMVRDMHANDLTVDTWYVYPFLGYARTYRQGNYDQMDYFNYWPSAEVLSNYATVLIYCNGPMYGGTYYY